MGGSSIAAVTPGADARGWGSNPDLSQNTCVSDQTHLKTEKVSMKGGVVQKCRISCFSVAHVNIYKLDMGSHGDCMEQQG